MWARERGSLRRSMLTPALCWRPSCSLPLPSAGPRAWRRWPPRSPGTHLAPRSQRSQSIASAGTCYEAVQRHRPVHDHLAAHLRTAQPPNSIATAAPPSSVAGSSPRSAVMMLRAPGSHQQARPEPWPTLLPGLQPTTDARQQIPRTSLLNPNECRHRGLVLLGRATFWRVQKTQLRVSTA